MGFQTLDAPFLLEQLLLVGNLCLQRFELLALRDQHFFLSFDSALPLLQLRSQHRLLSGQFASAAGEGFKLLPAAQAGLFVLPVLAQVR